jgi:hypothetical protein
LIPIRDPTKNPTPEELEALQPHPSLSQTEMTGDIPIDPQILVDRNRKNTVNITVVLGEEEEEEGEEDVIDYEIQEDLGSEGYVSDDSMKADFIRFKY